MNSYPFKYQKVEQNNWGVWKLETQYMGKHSHLISIAELKLVCL